MVTTARLRASDHDRDEAIAALREHHADGRIDIAEFTTRMEAAQSAVFVADLAPLFADLPVRAPTSRVPAPLPRVRPGPPRRVRFVAVAGALAVVILIAMSVTGGGFPPLWIPLMALWLLAIHHRRRARNIRRGQWRYVAWQQRDWQGQVWRDQSWCHQQIRHHQHSVD